ncbi:MAG: UvrD-helicase domain-containing protein [Thermoanaerobaculia bacterium]|nr:UvrD-helicase domain-containing protein [Thermoanaerobaculia bacterium]
MARGDTIDFERALNPEQFQAATHGPGPQLVLAGAGSGKTRVITYRIGWLVQGRGIDPSRIVAVTFTNKAAQEMRERAEALLRLYPLPTFVGTFHRYALRLLRAYGDRVGLTRDFAIFDSADQKSLVKKALAAEKLDPTAFQPQAVLAAISAAKNRLLTPAEYEREADDFFRARVARVYRRYQTLLRENGGVDFDDMISLAVLLLRGDDDLRARLRQRTEYLMVDEFQDTNHAQLSLVKVLCGPDGNLTAVGDEDQGIYRWRGAELDNILRFERHFPGAVERKLERNYRSTQNILDASGELVAHNQGRRGKRLWTDAGSGEPVVLYRARDEQDEASWVLGTLSRLEPDFKISEMAVLVRTNAQTRAFEEELLRRRMPYSLVGGVRFYERAEVKDVLAYLRLVRNPRDAFSFARVLNRPARGIGKTTQEQLERRAEELGKTVWDVLVEDRLEGFPKRGAQALEKFRDLVAGLRGEAEQLPLPAFLRRVLEATAYPESLQGDPEGEARLENVRELVSAAQEFTERSAFRSDTEDLLTAFLDHVSLVNDVDSWSTERGVALMTLHSAKGLEFGAVVVAGLEEGLLPHFNAARSEEDLEEERRLLYVGMTRAEKRLFLTTCRRGGSPGNTKTSASRRSCARSRRDWSRSTRARAWSTASKWRACTRFSAAKPRHRPNRHRRPGATAKTSPRSCAAA